MKPIGSPARAWRLLAVAVALAGLVTLSAAEGIAPQPAPNPANDAFLEKCTNIIKYGDRMGLYKPSKADAIIALGVLGDDRAVPILTEYYEHEEETNLRYRIVQTLAWIGGPKAVPALEKALKDQYPLARKMAAEALKRITGREPDYDKTGIPDYRKMREMMKASAAGATTTPEKSAP